MRPQTDDERELELAHRRWRAWRRWRRYYRVTMPAAAVFLVVGVVVLGGRLAGAW
jgi:hypothetical protein